MGVKRMDNVGIVVEDLDAVIAFFTELGLEVEGRMNVNEEWAGRVVGLPGQDVDIAMLRTPDGHSKLELMHFRRPAAVDPRPDAPPNAYGLRRLMFAVDDIRDTVARLERHGGELMGEIVPYEDVFLLCYVRGPEGLMLGLAEELR